MPGSAGVREEPVQGVAAAKLAAVIGEVEALAAKFARHRHAEELFRLQGSVGFSREATVTIDAGNPRRPTETTVKLRKATGKGYAGAMTRAGML